MVGFEDEFDNITTQVLKRTLWEYTFKDKKTALLEGDVVEVEGTNRRVRFLGVFNEDGISRQTFEARNEQEYARYTTLSMRDAAIKVLRLGARQATDGARLASPLFIEAYHKAYDHIDDPDF